MGREEYGGTSSIEDIIPILYGRFPKLKYLGLRNSEYTNDIVYEIVDSPIINNLIELDFSMGSLTDEGAEILLNCPAIHELDTLDISDNCLSNEMIEKINNLDIEVINLGYQKHPDERYCTVGE